ncbi:MAG: peptidase MA family metallohydrolase, partial [Planctomycetota bacterium]|nr:peptidase MA family metallohydrolase [Planctomycetota bacterium]
LALRDGARALGLLDRALSLHPGRLVYERLRAEALLALGRAGEALRQAEQVSERSPDYADGWFTLGQVRERSGELRAALEAFGRAATLRPADDALARRIEEVTRRADAESGFATHGSGHFAVKYDPDIDSGTVQLALELLEDAYSRVTSDLGIAPRTVAQVVLYEGGEFQRVTGAHSWVGALYQEGVLRVPLRNLERHRATAARVLTHEFTHHVLKERTPALPTWWHEGIAQFLEDAPEASRARRTDLAEMLGSQQRTSRLIRLQEMQELIITRVENAGTVKLYYAQALSFVGWLVDTYGAAGLPSFVHALAAGTGLDDAARKAFGDDQAGLWAAWIASL